MESSQFDPQAAASVLAEGLQRLLGLARRVLSVEREPLAGTPWTRPDVYAGGMLAAASEHAAGLLAESQARRSLSSTALARHLWEYEIELTWILADPSERLRRKYAEEARNVFERLPPNWHDAARAGGLGDVEDLMVGLRRDLGLGPRAGLMPGFEAMATGLGRADDWKEGYPVMSWQAHPGLSGAGRHVVLSADAATFVADMHGAGSQLASPLVQGVLSFAACVRLSADELDVPLGAELVEAESTARLIRSHLNDLAEDARQLRPSERQEPRD